MNHLHQPVEQDSPDLFLLQAWQNCRIFLIPLCPSRRCWGAMSPQQTPLSVLQLCPGLCFCPVPEGLSCTSVPLLLLAVLAPAQGYVFSCHIRGPLVKNLQERKNIKVNVVVAQKYYIQKDSCIYKNHKKFLSCFQQVNKRRLGSCSYLIKTGSCVTGKNISCAKMCFFSSLFLTSGAWTELREAGWHLAAVLHLI